MIQDHQAQVREFHEAMNLSIRDTPGRQTPQVCDLRIAIVQEEAKEFEAAVNDPYAKLEDSLVQVADALGDLLYVTYGAAIAFGIDIHPIFNAIHRANMRKVGGPKGENGKQLKPPGWVGPEREIRLIIRHQQGLVEQYDGAEYEGVLSDS